MSSVSSIAVAQPLVDPWEGAPADAHPPQPLASPGSQAPPVPPDDPPWLVALDCQESRANPAALGNAWEDLVRGRLRPLRETITRDCVCLVAQVIGRPSGLCPDDASLVVHVLCGEPRKALACDLGIALSTATGRFLRALARLELADRNVPLPLVLAAQCWAGVARIRNARSALFDCDGSLCLAVSVPRPATAHLPSLTRGEQEVAQWLMEGLTRYEIADRRDTSVHTVAGQFHRIFAALRVTGRYELIRRAVGLGCFHELRIADAT